MMRVVGAEDQDCENFEICMKITVREWDESAAHRLFYLFLFFYYNFLEGMDFDNSTLTRWNLERGGASLWGAFIGMASIFFKICSEYRSELFAGRLVS